LRFLFPGSLLDGEDSTFSELDPSFGVRRSTTTINIQAPAHATPIIMPVCSDRCDALTYDPRSDKSFSGNSLLSSVSTVVVLATLMVEISTWAVLEPDGRVPVSSMDDFIETSAKFVDV
jgi:hypothetical protein